MASTDRDNSYTVAEVAEMLNVSKSTVRRWIRAGKLPAHHVGSRSLRIRRNELQTLQEAESLEAGWKRLSPNQRRALLFRPLSNEELQARKELFEEVMVSRKGRSIAPLTSDELVRLSRDRDFTISRW